MILSILFFGMISAKMDSPSILELDLKKTVDLALERNLEMQKARERLNQGRALYWQGWSRLGPTLDGTLNYRRQKDASTTVNPRFNGKSYNFYEWDLEARQTLLRRGSLAAVSAVSSDLRLREIDLSIAERDITFEVLLTYQKLLYSTKEVSLLEQTEQVYQKSLRFTRERQKIGRSPKLDLLQVRAEVALIAPELEKAKNDLLAEKQLLANQLALTGTEDLQVSGALVTPPLSILRKTIFSEKGSNLEVQRAKESRSQFQDRLVTALGSHWPKLEAVGNYGRSSFAIGDLDDSNRNRWSLGLSLNVPLFSSFLYWNEKRQYESQLFEARLEEQRANEDNQYQKTRSEKDLETAYAVLVASEEARKLVKEALIEARRQYELSAIDYARLLTAERSYVEAERSFFRAELETMTKLTEYFRAHGIASAKIVELVSGS